MNVAVLHVSTYYTVHMRKHKRKLMKIALAIWLHFPKTNHPNCDSKPKGLTIKVAQHEFCFCPFPISISTGCTY